MPALPLGIQESVVVLPDGIGLGLAVKELIIQSDSVDGGLILKELSE